MDVAARTRSAGARPYRFFDTLESRKDARGYGEQVGSCQQQLGARCPLPTAHCLLTSCIIRAW